MRGIAVCVLMLTLSLWTVQRGKASPWKQQKTYSSSQFPQYRLLQKTPHFEYRSYEPSTLVSTEVPVNSSINDLFGKLTNLNQENIMYVNVIHAISGRAYEDKCSKYEPRPNVYRCHINKATLKLECLVEVDPAWQYFTGNLAHETLKDCSYEGLGVIDTKGDPCYFPFEYGGVRYHACTTRDSIVNRQWCSNTGDWKGKWGYCPLVVMQREEEDLPELSVAYVLPREMEAKGNALAGGDVTVTALPAGNICTRDLETTDMAYDMVLATASELVKHCPQTGHNHTRISLVKYLDRDEPRAEMWYM